MKFPNHSNHGSAPRLSQQCTLLVGGALIVSGIIIVLQFSSISGRGSVGSGASVNSQLTTFAQPALPMAGGAPVVSVGRLPGGGFAEVKKEAGASPFTRSFADLFSRPATNGATGPPTMHIDHVDAVVDHYHLEHKRVFTTLTTAQYCFNILVLYKSMLRVDLQDIYALVVFHVEPIEQMLAVAECSVLYQQAPRCLFMQVPDIMLPKWSTPQNFGRMAMNKFAIFRFPEKMGRVVHLDGDITIAREPHSLFEIEMDTHIAACVDQWDGCQRRDVYNTGILSVTPKRFIYDALLQRTQFASCLSGTWQWAEQEDVNCICGGAGQKKKEAPDINCKLLPEIYGAYPGVSEQCGVPAKDIIIFHYAGPFEKPPFEHLKHDPTKMEMTRKYWLCLYENRSLMLNDRVIERLRKECDPMGP